MRSDYEMGSIDGGQLERVGSEIPSEEFYRTPCNSTTASSRCSGRISPAQSLPGIRNNSVGSSPRSDLHLIRRRRQESVAERGHTFRNHSRFSNNTTDSSFVLATPQEIGLPSLSSEELNTWMWYHDQSVARRESPIGPGRFGHEQPYSETRFFGFGRCPRSFRLIFTHWGR
jgi:hypothetical protein